MCSVTAAVATEEFWTRSEEAALLSLQPRGPEGSRVIELDTLYIDVAIRRWEAITGVAARHAETGLSFALTQAARNTEHNETPASRPRLAKRKPA
jgi:hypothetical protein